MKHGLLIGAALLASTSAQMVSAQEIATWKGFRTSAVSFTFDDNLQNQLTYAVPLFDQYGYKATFNVVTNWVGNSWGQWKTLVNNGHEVTSHTVSHTVNGDNELTASKTTIKNNTGSECVTIAYPNCNVPSNRNLLQQTYIGGRICNGQVEGKTPSNFYEIGSIICGNTMSSNNSTQGLINHLNTAKSKGGWCVYLIHEVNNGSGYSPLSADCIAGTLKHINQNDQDFWCCTFAQAIKYIKERDAAKATLKSNGGSTLTFSLSDNLDDNIYNYPLSLRYKNPGWSKVSGKQGSKTIEAYILNGYIYFDATPDAGDIVLSGDGASTPEDNPGEQQGGQQQGSQQQQGGQSSDVLNPCDYKTKLSGGTTLYNQNKTGTTSTGYSYEIWRDGTGGELTLYPKDACFKASWNNAGDFLGRVGKTFNKPSWNNLGGELVASYAYDKGDADDGGTYSYIGVYGWMDNPQIEYYVVDDWMHSRGVPGGSYIGKSYGKITVDGAVYEVWSGSRTGDSKWGNSTFTQIFSIRQTPRQCGVINVSEHFRQWDKLGLQLGQIMEAQILVEAGGGKGTVDFTYATVTIGDYTPLPVEPIKPSEKEEPYDGAIAIPGTLECENYDKGGNGFGYYDSDNVNEGKAYREDGVDIVSTTDGYAIGYTTDSEWLKYTVNVEKDDKYTVEAYMANGNTKTPKITLTVDGKSEYTINGVGQGGDDWDTYAMSESTSIPLTKGEHTIVLNFNSNYTNIDYVKFTGTISGIEDVYADDITLLPNPANSFVEISTKDEIKSVKFFDMLGKVTNFEESKKIDVSSLNPGIYAVEIETENTKVVKKLTIRK